MLPPTDGLMFVSDRNTLSRQNLFLPASAIRIMRLIQLVLGFWIGLTPLGAFAAGPNAPQTRTITWDHYSLMIDGERVFIYSGEFHPFRLPVPQLWQDILEKMKAAGFNTVSVYFDWDFHSLKAGVYDFTGIRDMDRFLKLAEQAGLYVIVRLGPYINAETDSGGFPGWLTTVKGRARTTDSDYLNAALEWLKRVDRMIGAHQLTNGTGTVIACQVENEFYVDSVAGQKYMEALEHQMRADGITVPLTGNHDAHFTSGTGATDIVGFDNYPQTDASNPAKWGWVPDYQDIHESLPNKPLYLAEFQGGWFDAWGGSGYEACYTLTGPDFENVLYKSLIVQGATMLNYYMTYGGTSWGWLPFPGVYSSYDYGAAIDEARQLTDKYSEQKLIASFTQAVQPLTKTDKIVPAPPDNSALSLSEHFNPDDQTAFYLLVPSDLSVTKSKTNEQTHIAINLLPGYTYDDTSPTLKYNGTWTPVSNMSYTVGDYHSTQSFSNTAGDTVSLQFDGTAVRWIGSKDRNHGIAEVYLDGKQETIDTYAPSRQPQVVLFEAHGLDAKTPHKLTIRVTGKQNPNSAGSFVSIDAIDLPPVDPTPNFYPKVPQQPGTAITVNGRDAKLLLANYWFGAKDAQQKPQEHLVYSTSQLMTNGSEGDTDFAVFYDNNGNDGETVLRYPTDSSKPEIRASGKGVTSDWDPKSGDLRLNYVHDGLTTVSVQQGGKRKLLLFLCDTTTATQLWLTGTNTSPLLVSGPYLVRSASTDGDRVVLKGDTDNKTQLSVLFPQNKSVSWGAPGSLSDPPKVKLPQLNHWKFRFESPERSVGFNDSDWVTANRFTTNNPTQPPSGQPVLYEDDYGFHHGNVWYRGHFIASGNETGVKIDGEGGAHGIFAVWLNGALLSWQSSGLNTFQFPPGVVQPGRDNVIAVLVMNMGHEEDTDTTDSYKKPRGILSAALVGADTRIDWKIQGNLGAEDPVDPVRGPMNVGGLYGERHGWFLPGFPDAGWPPVTLPDSWHSRGLPPGIGWYRTTFELQLPPNTDVPIGLRITDDRPVHYRAFIFLNGWILGIYANDLGPQKLFSLPPGILNTNGSNALAIAVWGQDNASGGLGQVSLQEYGAYNGGVSVGPVNAPGWSGAWGETSVPNNLALGLTSDRSIIGGITNVNISGTLTNAGNLAVQLLSVQLRHPEGWTVEPNNSLTAAMNTSSASSVITIEPGQSIPVSWTVKSPQLVKSANYQLAAVATYQQWGSSASTAGTIILVAP